MTQQKAKPSGELGAVYIRVSGKQQDLASQTQLINTWLAENSLSVRRWYRDTGARDLAEKRPQFQEMLRAIEAGEITWVLVTEKDRFGGRDSYQFGSFVTFPQDHACELWSVSQRCLSGTDAYTHIMTTVDSL